MECVHNNKSICLAAKPAGEKIRYEIPLSVFAAVYSVDINNL